MAESTAPATPVENVAPGTSRGLWQAPVFVLGVGCLIAVWLTRPLLAARGDAQPLRRELAEARRLLERPDGDAGQAAKLAQQVLEQKDQNPDAAGEADLLLGTAQMRLAGRAEGAPAAELWASARKHLEAADKEGVPENEHAPLQYRLGVAGFHAGDKPLHVIALVKTSIDQADDPVEAYTVLTQAYLKCVPPDLQEARAANFKLRNLSQAKEEVLAPARLLGGELELRLGHTDEALRVLEKVGAHATPEIQAKARRLRARACQDEGRWAEAAALWQEAQGDGGSAGEALYNLGVCALRQEQNADAVRYWEPCARGGGDEGQAAAAALAELRLKGSNPETALEMFALVVDPVKPGADWSSPLIDRDAVVKLFHEAGKAFLESRHYDEAVRLAELFGRVAAPGEAEVLRGKASAEWAAARQEESRQAATAEAKKTADDGARDLFQQAATAYAAASEQTPQPADQAEYLWLSAHCSWDGQDLAKAAAKLEKVLQGTGTDERKGEAWYLLGEARRGLNDASGADAAYSECMKYQTPFAYRARYYRAQAAMARGALDEAQEALEQNLKMLRIDPDAEAHEKTLFALGGLFYNRGNYQMVVERLGEALPRFPANPEATRAHYQLADSYRQLADQASLNATLADDSKSQEVKEQMLKDYRRYLTNASKEFLDLAQLLDTPEGQGLLKQEEQVQVPFLAADCLFDLGNYSDALLAYETLASRYANRLEGLNALGGMVRCHSALGETDKMQQRLAEIEVLLQKMPDPVRQEWSEWLTIARKPVATP